MWGAAQGHKGQGAVGTTPPPVFLEDEWEACPTLAALVGTCRRDPSHSDIAVSRWAVRALLGLLEQSLERELKEMFLGGWNRNFGCVCV